MKLKLKASCIDFFVYTIFWTILDIVTVGFGVPFHIYFMCGYLINNTEVINNDKK